MVPADCQVEFLNTERDLHRICPSMPPNSKQRVRHYPKNGISPRPLSMWWVDPNCGIFQEITGRDPLLIDGKDDDQLHSPNEKYDVESFHKGIRSWAHILAN